MRQGSLLSFYQSRREHFASDERNAAKRARLYASLRLITALIVLAALWQIFSRPHWSWAALAAAATASFIFFVSRHWTFRAQQHYFGRLKTINEREMAKPADTFPEGTSYIDSGHPYTFDLDIFGKNSLFQLVNRTACPSGEQLLVKTLTTVPSELHLVLDRQEAIAELAPLVDFRQQFLAKGQAFDETPAQTRQLFDWLATPASPFITPLLHFLKYFLPGLVFFLLGGALWGALPHSWWILTVLLNLAILGLLLRRINRVHAILSQKHLLLEKFSALLEHMEKQHFNSSALRGLRGRGMEGFNAIKQLSKLLAFFDQRLNYMAGTVLNGFFLSDLHCITAIDRWRARHREQLPGWLENIFRMDELSSFANFAFNHPHYCRPGFQEEPFISAQQMGHPLIHGRECVPNDFTAETGEKVIILTGANMSGKSTFLRSVGINLVLAYAGAPVFARKFSCCLAGIHSSMRVSDSLGEDTSYFYAELKRLSVIMEQLRAGEKMFIFLDEILKGTNSADKLYGSSGLVEEFIGHSCLCFIATHDLDLGKMEEKQKGLVSNYCFESTLRNDELYFDYLLKKGIARNKNATFLMQKTGLIKRGH